MRRYIGIDFGTSNTHTAICTEDPEANALRVEPAKVFGESSFSTCILWKEPANQEADFESFGSKAEEDWALKDEEERNQFRLVYGFKPNIAGNLPANREAYFYACTFLSKICKSLSEDDQNLIRQGIAVIGVPAEIGKDHIDTTVKVAREAGFAIVECIEEPFGALASHLSDGSLKLEDAQTGVAVVDFGGGTFDVALVNSEENSSRGLSRSWGDPTLGGQLFDDLFYQWINEKNGGSIYNDMSEFEKKIIWMSECRKIKEAFSVQWAMKEASDFKGRKVDFKGRIETNKNKIWVKDLSIDEFKERAKHYTPSRLSRKHFEEHGKTGRIVSSDPINLFEWILDTLQGGLQGIEGLRRPKKIILTGGSASWPFMRSLVAQAFEIDPIEGILKSNHPAITIGSGLALYIGLRARHRTLIENIQSARPSFREQLKSKLAKRFEAFEVETANRVLDNVMPDIKKAVDQWYNKGGKLRTLEVQIERSCKEKENFNFETIKSECNKLNNDIKKYIRDHLNLLLKEHGIRKSIDKYFEDISYNPDSSTSDGEIVSKISNSFGELAESITTVTGLVVAAVIIKIKLALILALAILHPIAAMIVAIGALAALVGLGSEAKEWAEEKVKDFSFSGLSLSALQWWISPASLAEKLNSGRADAQLQIRNSIRKTISNARDEKGNSLNIEKKAIETFDKITELVISNLGVLEQPMT